ncbi:MAG: hypothetical protein HY306_06930 [Nitrosomonadales bacterium]|nr:hypothetical protein [Nitrosomonadales bacterium]
MIEFTLVVTAIVLMIVFLRVGETKALPSPLVINRVGQYHAVLAPMLNLAQPLLESISCRLGEQDRQSGNTPPLYFKVSDSEVRAHGEESYLLAVTLRDGMLYFQATAPQGKEQHLATIQTFSEAELSHHPDSRPYSDAAQAALVAATHAAANQRGATFISLEP